MPVWGAEGSAVFRHTKAKWGILSNFAPSPLVVSGIQFRTAEALYQACRFPDKPDLQRSIIEAKSPMTAKMLTKPWRAATRPDWHSGEARIVVMQWTLAIKWVQCADFRWTLASSQAMPVIESSARDSFWGAIPHKDDPNILEGENMLGRLLMQLRDAPPSRDIEPPSLPNFTIIGQQIGLVPNALNVGIVTQGSLL